MNTCAMIACAASFAFASIALAGEPPAIVPDNGTGTASLPPVGGTYVTPDDDLYIISGLPPGTTISADANLGGFYYNPGGSVYSFLGGPHEAGGSLGGDKWASDGNLQLPLIGHGTLAGFNRNIPLNLSFEIHAAPHMAFAPVQSFATDFFRGFGQITGDPDFDLLRVVAGTDFGLPSPGHTTLTQLGGGMWQVDSFFDITYRIDFVGAPGGALAGRSGSTTGTTRFQIGQVTPAPGAAALLGLGGLAAMRRRRR